MCSFVTKHDPVTSRMKHKQGHTKMAMKIQHSSFMEDSYKELPVLRKNDK